MRSRRLGVGAALVGGSLIPGDVAIAGDRITDVGLSPAGRGIAVPGLVDLQVNGFAGVDFLADDDDDAWRLAGEQLLATGVTAFQPTLITAPTRTVRGALRRAERLQRAQTRGAAIIGVHLEGAFLAAERLGTHPAEHRRDPDLVLLEQLLADGPVSMVTLAPELNGATQLIDTLVAGGVTVSIGHSAATASVAHAAFNRGARAVTHIFNAMAPLSAREPGVAGVALHRGDVIVQCILDGVHLADETLGVVLGMAAGRMSVTSDAIAAAGMGDGDYRLGTVPVTVRNGFARGPDGTLAGGVGTVLDGLRHAVRLGMSFEAAVGAATVVPARLLGRVDIGVIGRGAPADLVVFDDALQVLRVLKAGLMIEEIAS